MYIFLFLLERCTFGCCIHDNWIAGRTELTKLIDWNCRLCICLATIVRKDEIQSNREIQSDEAKHVQMLQGKCVGTTHSRLRA